MVSMNEIIITFQVKGTVTLEEINTVDIKVCETISIEDLGAVLDSISIICWKDCLFRIPLPLPLPLPLQQGYCTIPAVSHPERRYTYPQKSKMRNGAVQFLHVCCPKITPKQTTVFRSN